MRCLSNGGGGSVHYIVRGKMGGCRKGVPMINPIRSVLYYYYVL